MYFGNINIYEKDLHERAEKNPKGFYIYNNCWK